MKILIVEDDPDSRRLLKVRLVTAGFEVLEAEDGQAAWELFQAERCRLIITDWMMPRMDGPMLVRKIRAEGGPAYAYIIMLTALDDKSSVVTGLESGADEYLTKPFHPRELLARVATGQRVLNLQDSLAEQALHDGLTGLLNRRAIEEHARAELNRACRQNSALSLVIIDIDHFKAVNDRFGHHIGDLALRHVAAMLSHYVRPYDWAGRWGGEEFVLLFPGADLESAAQAAERIRANISETPLRLEDGRQVQLRASLGVACVSGEAGQAPASFERLVQRADAALYRAKSEGRDRVCASREA